MTKIAFLRKNSLIYTNKSLAKIEDCDYILSYDLYGNAKKVKVEKVNSTGPVAVINGLTAVENSNEDKEKVNELNGKKINAAVLRPLRKISILDTDIYVRDTVLETLERDEQTRIATLIFDKGKEADFVKLGKILPHYGFNVDISTSEMKIVLDKDYPPCFLSGWLMGPNKIEENIKSWALSGWLRMTKPEKKFIDLTKQTGVLWEGFMGNYWMRPVNIEFMNNIDDVYKISYDSDHFIETNGLVI